MSQHLTSHHMMSTDIREDLVLIAKSCDPFLSSMDYIFALQDSYSHVFSLIFREAEGEHLISSSSGRGRGSEQMYTTALKHLEDKLHGTVRTLGYEALVNSFIERACKTSDSSASSSAPGGDSLLGSTDYSASSSSADLTFKSALKCHVLNGEEKFSKSCVETRKVVRLLAQHCSPANLALVEMLWRDVIAESVLTLCSPLHPPSSLYYNNTPSPSPHTEEFYVGTSRSGAGVAYGINAVPGSPLSSAVSAAIASQIRPTHTDTPEMFASTLVDNLLAHLSKAREASRVDLRCVGCSMSADLAFAVAYRRLPGECGVELAKALAVKLSTLLDHSKSSSTGGNMNSTHPPLHQIADLIRVLFTQTSVEFQHFYEMLLARRLLKCKYSSLGNEREMIKLLPALDKSLLMIK